MDSIEKGGDYLLKRCLNERIKDFLDDVEDLIYLKDDEYRYVYANASHEEIIGLRDEQMIGRTDYDIMPRKNAQCCRESDEKALKEGKYSEEEYLEDRWYHVLKHRVESSEDGFVGVMGIIRDITDRKKHELKLNKETFRDPLTGVFNRRYYNEKGYELFERYRESSLSMILLDLDNFKRLNDSYGHLGGDMVLKEGASILKGSVRRGDLVFRIGGEEFLILLPEQGLETARRVAERIRDRSEKLSVRIGSSEVGFTLSAGVAQRKEGDTSLESVFKRADSRLYKAKEDGRNRVV